jgi:hypothetical protein
MNKIIKELSKKQNIWDEFLKLNPKAALSRAEDARESNNNMEHFKRIIVRFIILYVLPN